MKRRSKFYGYVYNTEHLNYFIQIEGRIKLLDFDTTNHNKFNLYQLKKFN